ncbi:hypothetical protein [Kitasatospora sp. NPDC093558]|uniref:hypothetical protein n=1 Tax=Kitasatospora sp. NPDC093558 TaxID=3155201 RepID=UPI00341EAEA2
MSIFRRLRASGPRVRPELDDVQLGRVRRQLGSAGRLAPDDIQIDQVERLLLEAGRDPDRRAHRFAVLAEAAAPSAFSRSWRLRRRGADPMVFEGWVELVRGRAAGRMDDARAAADHCYRAAEVAPGDPMPWVVLLGILRLMRAEPRQLYAVLAEVTSRDPWNREASLQMLRYLSPEECGSRSSQLDFVETLRASAPPASPVAGVELVALVDEHDRTAAKGGVEALLARRLWTHSRAAGALDAALAAWPRQGHLRHATALADLNLLAYALVQAGRVREAGAVFEAIGDTVTEWPWSLDGDPIERFTYWQAKAL